MADIELACHTAAWGDDGFINALADIEKAGFRGIETTTGVVEQFEDRVDVFNEILSQHQLQLIAITTTGAMWPGISLEEEVERSLNIVRFLKAANAKVLTLMPPMPNPDKPLEDEADILPVATAYGEIARRTLELGILPCLHPDVGSLVCDTKSLDTFLEDSDPAAMKLCVDVAFLAMAEIPMARFIKEHRKRIGALHLRDIKPSVSKRKKHDPASRFQTVELGKGLLKLEDFVDTLLGIEFSGWATVELEKGGKSLLHQAAASHNYAAQTLDLVL
ncbi:MAG: sugar phosphate isomerase/epimerase [Planctomycetota bacterium]|nr:sugar phosphate isomerase/epimerase [Planctomycetota bacterium]